MGCELLLESRDFPLTIMRLTILAMLALFVPLNAYAARGYVAYRVSGCDYFVVETIQGFDLLEWYGGHDPDKGDELAGSFESYGMKHIQDITADEDLTVWVEDFSLSKQGALEKLAESCE
jgi:hypothetical protein